MKIDDILKQYPYIAEDIQKEQEKLNKYIELQKEARNPLRGQAMDGMPHSTDISDQTYNAVVKIIDEYQVQINKHAANINKLLDRKKWLDKAFAELTEDERRLLYMAYDDRLSFRQIGRIYKCGRYMAQKLIEEAKEKIKRIAM
ncbi:MAG: sigma factor-like helix-turn-helix DNA-binding protein [Caulobacteraceae bacterium]